MRRTQGWRLSLVALVLLAVGNPAWTQRRPPSSRLPQPTPSPEPPPFPTPSRKLLQARFAELQKDVDHLQELARELKEEVDKASEDVLPVSGLKRAEEIEKLARKIQGRIKNL